MKKDFGLRVAEIVKENSENKYPGGNKNKKATWGTRKKRKLIQIKNASRGALMVNAADKIHNLRSIIRNYSELGEKLWKKFNAPPEKKYWYYKEAVNIISKRLGGKISRELKKVYIEALELFEKNNRNLKKRPPLYFFLRSIKNPKLRFIVKSQTVNLILPFILKPLQKLNLSQPPFFAFSALL